MLASSFHLRKLLPRTRCIILGDLNSLGALGLERVPKSSGNKIITSFFLIYPLLFCNNLKIPWRNLASTVLMWLFWNLKMKTLAKRRNYEHFVLLYNCLGCLSVLVGGKISPFLMRISSIFLFMLTFYNCKWNCFFLLAGSCWYSI